VNGEYYAEWALSGGITTIVEITSQDANSCVMNVLTPPIELVSGTLTLTLKKSADASIIVTATKALEAMIEGVVITKTSNPGVQAALYNAGLVANENYSLQEEVEKITASQLQPGTSSSTTIFYAQRNNINSFDEFQYFTGLTKVPDYCFASCSNIQKIKLPSSITEIGKQSFYYCQKLQWIEIPETVNIFGAQSFYYCRAFTEFKFPDKVKTLGDNMLGQTENITDIYMPSVIEDRINSWSGGGSNTRIHIKSFASWVSFRFNTNGSTPMNSNSIMYLNGEPVTHFIVPEGVTSLGRCALYNLNGVTDITIPDSVTTIGHQTIGDPDLQRIHGGRGLKTIDNNSLDNVSENLQIDMDCSMVAIYSSIGNYRYAIKYNNTNVSGRSSKPSTFLKGSTRLYAYDGGKFTDGTTKKTIDLQQTGRIIDISTLYPIGYITITINSNLSDAEFIVNYTSFTGESKEKTVLAGSATEFDMDGANEFTIVAKNEYSGYKKPVYTYSTPAYNDVTITLNYEEIQGIYIQHIDGTLYTTDEWTAGGYANDQANGVAFTSVSTSFVIAKEDASSSTLKWGGYGKLITDIVTTSSSATAVLDFDGENNTTKIIEQLSGYTDSNSVTGAPAAETCVAYVFPNGKTGYLGTLGQWQVVLNNREAVKSAMSLIGGTTFSLITNYWASTQYSTNNSWAISWRFLNTRSDDKNQSNYIRAFCALT
jgi:hypothetical protein